MTAIYVPARVMKIINIDKLYAFLANFGISSGNNLG